MMRYLKSFYLYYLRLFARLRIGRVDPVIVGVGGSSGKSSVALFISLILKTRFKVKEGKGKNSETGIPLNILDFDIKSYSYFSWLKVFILAPFKAFGSDKYDFYIAEMGIDSPLPPKNMDYLLTIIQPDIGVLTSIGPEHTEAFDPLVKEDDLERESRLLDLIKKQEELLVTKIEEKGWSVLNVDDSNIAAIKNLKSKTITISSKKESDVVIKKIDIEVRKFTVEFSYMEKNYTIKINQALPEYYANSILLAVFASVCCGLTVEEAIRSLEKNFELPPGRFSSFEGVKDTLIFDSSYNSSPEAVLGALNLVKKVKGKRKIGVLGDMREQGSLTRRVHEEMGKAIIKNLDYVILIGPENSKYTSSYLRKRGFNHKSFLTFKEAKEHIKEEIRSGDIVLVKGSQNTLFLERVVEMLLKNPKDKEKLCRRGKYWDNRRLKSD
jgi:UDP-N-acetylmuramoyl-tripeptide--D-alanyl-D-alanine ligase